MLYGLKFCLFVLISSLMVAGMPTHVALLINAFLMHTSLIHFSVLYFRARSQHSAKQCFSLTVVLCWGLTNTDRVYGAVPSQEAIVSQVVKFPTLCGT
jgi:hypothetical protein